MDNKLSELKAAAMAATPGPWGINRTGNTIVSNHSHPVATVSDAFHRQLAGGGVGKDAEFIAAANPAAVLALLAELEASKKSNAFLKEQLAKLANFNPDWDMLEACRESWREVAAALKKTEAKLEAKDKRIAELEAIRSDASQVFKEIATELGCNPDNEPIMMAIDELKSTQMAGPLALIIKRAEEMERILEGVTPEMIAGGWTAKGISDYAKSLEAKLATPVRLPRTLWYEHDDLPHEIPVLEKKKVVAEIRAAGFKVEGDE